MSILSTYVRQQSFEHSNPNYFFRFKYPRVTMRRHCLYIIIFNRCSTTGGSRWLLSQLSPLCGSWRRPDLTWPDLICFVFFVFCHRDWRRQGEGLATSRVQQSNKVVPDVDGVIGTRFLRMPHFYLSFHCLADFSALEVVSVSHSMNVSLSWYQQSRPNTKQYCLKLHFKMKKVRAWLFRSQDRWCRRPP